MAPTKKSISIRTLEQKEVQRVKQALYLIEAKKRQQGLPHNIRARKDLSHLNPAEKKAYTKEQNRLRKAKSRAEKAKRKAKEAAAKQGIPPLEPQAFDTILASIMEDAPSAQISVQFDPGPNDRPANQSTPASKQSMTENFRTPQQRYTSSSRLAAAMQTPDGRELTEQHSARKGKRNSKRIDTTTQTFASEREVLKEQEAILKERENSQKQRSAAWKELIRKEAEDRKARIQQEYEANQTKIQQQYEADQARNEKLKAHWIDDAKAVDTNFEQQYNHKQKYIHIAAEERNSVMEILKTESNEENEVYEASLDFIAKATEQKPAPEAATGPFTPITLLYDTPMPKEAPVYDNAPSSPPTGTSNGIQVQPPSPLVYLPDSGEDKDLKGSDRPFGSKVARPESTPATPVHKAGSVGSISPFDSPSPDKTTTEDSKPEARLDNKENYNQTKPAPTSSSVSTVTIHCQASTGQKKAKSVRKKMKVALTTKKAKKAAMKGTAPSGFGSQQPSLVLLNRNGSAFSNSIQSPNPFGPPLPGATTMNKNESAPSGFSSQQPHSPVFGAPMNGNGSAFSSSQQPPSPVFGAPLNGSGSAFSNSHQPPSCFNTNLPPTPFGADHSALPNWNSKDGNMGDTVMGGG
ncbi:unnamed protein product [Cylindrotheca closterium]|uniref:Uncharacterized protein n=1 Tax=Cylindrotheca closterium TaxID=2856 RepID=A0AAD2CHY7_9STRA|nr:unnamed protein product [Cylindrotheca closterium]